MLKQKIKKNSIQHRKSPISPTIFHQGKKSSNDRCYLHMENMENGLSNEESLKAKTFYLNSNELPEQKHPKRLSTSLTIRSTKQRIYSPWKCHGDEEGKAIKGIGFHPDSIKERSVQRFGFPKRKQRNCEQSLSNFLLKYGRSFKKYQQEKQQKQSMLKNLNTPHSVITNAATIKLKPRLYWFQRRNTSQCEKRIHDRLISARSINKP